MAFFSATISLLGGFEHKNGASRTFKKKNQNTLPPFKSLHKGNENIDDSKLF